MAKKIFTALGIALFLFVFLTLSFVSATNIDFDCLTVKPSIYENGGGICWHKPSPEFQRTINAEAFKLGYDVQPDGTFKKAVD